MDTQYEALLNSGDVPLDDQRSSISALLDLSLTELRDIDAQMASLSERRLKTLDAGRSYKAILSPLRKLPPDMLREVFVRCLSVEHNTVMSAKVAPVLLGRVCSSWRSIVMSTPALWASIHIVIPMSENGTGDLSPVVQRAAIHEWLTRSGSLPLSISVIAGGDRPMGPEAYMFTAGTDNSKVKANLAETFRVILAFSQRWKRVDFRLDSLNELSNLSVDDVPMLQELSASRRIYGTIVASQLAPVIQAPSLRKISLKYLNANPLSMPLPFPQLTHVDLLMHRGISFLPAHALELLRRCPSLESCAFYVQQDSPMEAPGVFIFPHAHNNVPTQPPPLVDIDDDDLPLLESTETVCMEHLHTLSVRCIPTEMARGIDLRDLFSYLHLPALRILTYEGFLIRMLNDLQNYAPLPLLSLPIMPPIENLSIMTEDRLWDTDFMEFIRLNPHLKHLRLREPLHLYNPPNTDQLNSTFLHFLKVSDSSSANATEPLLCPFLESLDIGFLGRGSTSSATVTDLLEILKTRCPPPEGTAATLKRVHVRFEGLLKKEDQDQLNAFAKAVAPATKVTFREPPRPRYMRASPWEGIHRRGHGDEQPGGQEWGGLLTAWMEIF